jgi:hypothetical protein
VDLKSPFHNEKLISDFSHLRSKQDLLEPPQTTFTEMPILTQRGNNKWTIEQGAYFQSESRRGSRAMQESRQPFDLLNEQSYASEREEFAADTSRMMMVMGSSKIGFKLAESGQLKRTFQ